MAFNPPAIFSGFVTRRSVKFSGDRSISSILDSPSLLIVFPGSKALIYPRLPGVNIKAAVADESDERHSEFGCEFDCQARWSTDRREDGYAGHQSLLHTLKTRTPADQQNFVG